MSGFDWEKDDGCYDNNAVERDGFDDDAYDQSAEALPELSQLETTFAGKKYGKAFLEDLHTLLCRPDPVIRPAEELSETVQKNRELLDEIAQTTDYQKWHRTTEFDYVRSALGTVELAKAIDMTRLPDDADERRRVLRQILRKSGEAVEEQLDGYAALCGKHPGEGELTDLGDVAKSKWALGRLPKRLMEIAGRMRRIALAKHKARVRHGPDEIVDVETGDNLARVLPCEFANLSHPLLKLEFLRKFANKELLQYRIDGNEPLGRGPIVVMIDTSGSMKGEREFWSKGIALGLLSIAIEESRHFSLILFSGPRNLKRFDFEKPSLDLIVNALSFFYGGGTCFETPLSEALTVIEGSKFKKADMILLTDGECSISPDFERDFKARKKAKDARLFSVLIGFNSDSLNPISEGVERIDDLSNDDSVTDLVFGGL